jgi:hypothetical protein
MFSFLIGGMPFCSELFIAVLILLSKYSAEGSSLLIVLHFEIQCFINEYAYPTGRCFASYNFSYGF